jgi:lipopolysaccharide transport system ATP-binding protein
MSFKEPMTLDNNTVIQCTDLGKCYQIYDNPKARLKQAIWKGRRQYFREFWALRNISFEVKRGESLGIIGRNGSGKSTLLQLICGTLTPTEGTIRTKGRIAALLELGSGFNPEFTGLENVYLNASMLGLSKDETDKRLDDILAFADIGDFLDQPVKTYSSGMAVRLAFAVIAHVDADILVVDEALAVGDTIFVQRCMRFIRRIREERCLLFVSHDAEAVKSLCSHSLWLSKGNQQALGDCKTVCLDYLRYCSATSYGEEVSLTPTGKSASSTLEKNEHTKAKELRSQDLFDYESVAEAKDNLANADGWQTGDADLISVKLRDLNNSSENPILRGGEDIEIEIEAIAHKNLERPALGFTLVNRSGLHLLGENTLITRENEGITHAAPGSRLIARFTLLFPNLPSGQYMLMASIADGDLHDHVQHHWTENAVIINVSTSKVRYGLVGAFLKDAKLDVEAET